MMVWGCGPKQVPKDSLFFFLAPKGNARHIQLALYLIYCDFDFFFFWQRWEEAKFKNCTVELKPEQTQQDSLADAILNIFSLHPEG